jgi:hypothetical protein
MDAVSQLGIDDARGIIVVRPDVGTRDAGTCRVRRHAGA